MSKAIFILPFLLLLLKDIAAQQHAVTKFHSLNQVGLLEGENTSSFHLQSVNGFQCKDWFAGIGAGLDYYRFRGIPLFLDLRKYIGREKNQFFLYADGGAHFAWDKQDKQINSTITHQPGFYSNTGIGFKAELKNGMAVVLNAGFSYKRVNEIQEQTICPFIGPCYVQKDRYNYDFRRLIIQVGWMF